MNILNGREERFNIIQNSKWEKSIVLVHANIAGNNKKLNFSYFLVDYFKNLIKDQFIVSNELYYENSDGPFYLLEVDLNPKELKSRLIEIEEEQRLGRLIDLDVYFKHETIKRVQVNTHARKCLVCEREAHICIRSKSHDVKEIIQKQKEIFLEFLEKEILSLIEEAIMAEFKLEQKFGLVSKNNRGSHEDMNFNSFVRSKDAILPYFWDVFLTSYYLPIDEAFTKGRKIGLEAEKAMFKATDNVNTHKGLIFVLGFVVLALGKCFKEYKFNLTENIIYASRNLLHDFNKEVKTFGEEVYHKYQILGIRGEVMKGLPNVRRVKPMIKSFSQVELTMALIRLIENVEDTVLLKRAQTIERYNYFRKLIGSISEYNQELIEKYTKISIEENISFGGSADLLVVAIFIRKIEEKFKYIYE